MQRTDAAPAVVPAGMGQDACLCCLGRHRAHTCGLGGRRGRPKGSTGYRRQLKNSASGGASAAALSAFASSALQSHLAPGFAYSLLPHAHLPHPHAALLASLHAERMPTAAAQGAVVPGSVPGVRYQGAGAFAAELLAQYDAVGAALASSGGICGPLPGQRPLPPHEPPAPVEQQPALMRFALVLYYVDTILRACTGVWAALEFGPPSVLAQPPTVRDHHLAVLVGVRFLSAPRSRFPFLYVFVSVHARLFARCRLSRLA